MDIQRIIQVIADLFASKKRGDAPNSMLNQVLTATRETRDDGGDDVPSTTRTEGEGLIGYYSLTDWWLSTFTAEERNEIQARRPSLVTGDNQDIILTEQARPGSTAGRAESSLMSLGIEFIQSKDFGIAERLIAKATEVGGASLLDKHFHYQQMAQAYYRHRNDDPEALALAIDACEKQILLGPEAAKAFLAEDPEDFLPAHHGFQQLAIIQEREKNYTEAIGLCREAIAQGWGGDWEKRITRCENRLAKLG
jgi:hypothetical protein